MAEGIKSNKLSFTFIGDATWSDKNFVKSSKSDKGWVTTNLNLGVKIFDGNVIYTELKGGKWGDIIDEDGVTTNNTVIKTLDSSNNKMEIAWKDRLDSNIIKNVANFKKIQVELERDEANNLIAKEFITEEDAIAYITSHLHKKDRIFVYGNVEFDRYKDKQGVVKIRQHKNIQHIRLANEDEKNQANGKAVFYFTKDSFSKDRFKQDKQYDVTALHTMYWRETKKTVPVPINYVLDCHKINFDNEQQVAMVDFLTEIFTEVKKDKVFKTEWQVEFMEGSEIGEITVKDLTKDLKQRIELGFISEEQALDVARNNAIGDKVKEIKLIMPLGMNNREETDYTIEDMIPPTLENKTETVKTEVEKDKEIKQEEQKKDVKAEFQALFGGK